MTDQRSERPPVEAMSDVAWARVERNVFAHMEGTVTGAVVARDVVPEPRKSWLWLAIPAAAAAAAALAFFSTSNGSSVPAAEPEPSRFVAGAAPSEVSVGDSHITLGANSAVIMDRSSSAILENGAALFSVAPRGDRPPFVVLAGDAHVRANDAQFRITREGELAAVGVDRGNVVVVYRGKEV